MKKLKSIIKKIFTIPGRNETSAKVRYEETEKLGYEIERKRAKIVIPEKEETVIF